VTESEKILDGMLEKHGVKDDYARCVFFNWANEFNFNLDSSPKEKWAMDGKIVEYLFCQETKEMDLGFHFEFNFNDMFSHDMWLVKSKYHWVPVDYKKQRNTIHPAKENPFQIHGGNFCTLRDDKMSQMCRENLPLIVIDRDIDFKKRNNSRVLFFKEKFNWTEKDFKLKDSRHIIICAVDRLCEMREKKDQMIELKIPEEKNYARNGKFNGATMCFSMDAFHHIDITEHQKKS